MGFKVNEAKGYSDYIESDNKKIKYTAYPMSLDITINLMEAQEEENQVKLLKAFSRYFDECIEFERVGFKNPKEEIKKELERSGKFIEFINYVLEKVGKQTEQKDLSNGQDN